MSKTLFEEAVADANKLRELAEETAKNKVVEAVMPQIRDLINRKILGEDIDLDEEIPMVDLEDHHEEEVDDYRPEKEVSIEASSESPDVGISVDGDVTINLEVETESDDDEDEGELVMDQAMAEALTRLIGGVEEHTNPTEEKLNKLGENVKKLSSILETVNKTDLTNKQIKRLNLSYMYCVREALKLKSEVILTEQTTQERLERRLTETIKEIRNMSKSNRRNIFDFLFEGEDEKKKMEELEEAELSLELSAEDQEELAAADDAEAVEASLEDILGDLELSLDAEEGAEEEEEEAEEEEEEAEEEEEEEELDLEEGDHMATEADMEETYEIDENMLRDELAKMMSEDAADADPSLAHGGEEIGDVLLDIDEDDLINALAEELAPTTKTVKTTRTSALTEARAEIEKYKQAVTELKTQLVEMNLFNAKLLYANKLMQNKDLTMKQQKAIVEALDNAKTLREAKLLFKSLTESLNRKTRKNDLNEGSLRTIGSSSRSTRSAAPKKSGPEVDRWAVLAGLNRD
jgi:hypothetical protein